VNPILLVIIACLFGGCATRTPSVAMEPDTEWIMAQYQGQNESSVNERRLQEGW